MPSFCESVHRLFKFLLYKVIKQILLEKKMFHQTLPRSTPTWLCTNTTFSFILVSHELATRRIEKNHKKPRDARQCTSVTWSYFSQLFNDNNSSEQCLFLLGAGIVGEVRHSSSLAQQLGDVTFLI